MRFFPITAKLNPFAGAQNWAYLMASTAITRLVTGLARVYEDRPAAQDPALTEPQKRQACLERFFVEIFGTSSYLLFLHMGQDITSKFLEPKLKTKFNELLKRIEDPKTGLNAQQVQNAQNTLKSVYGGVSDTMITSYLYGQKLPDKKVAQVTLQSMKALMKDDDLFHYVRSAIPLDKFTSMLRQRAAISVFGGVAASAIFGGFITQWLNDRVFAPAVRRTLEKRFNAKQAAVVNPTSALQQAVNVNLPVAQTPTVSAAANAYSTMPLDTHSSMTRPALNYSMPIPGAWSNALGGLPR